MSLTSTAATQLSQIFHHEDFVCPPEQDLHLHTIRNIRSSFFVVGLLGGVAQQKQISTDDSCSPPQRFFFLDYKFFLFRLLYPIEFFCNSVVGQHIVTTMMMAMMNWFEISLSPDASETNLATMKRTQVGLHIFDPKSCQPCNDSPLIRLTSPFN